jgi:heptosyltransferase II
MTKGKEGWLKESPTNIIVRMPNWLGDAVMATPVLEDLRHHFKRAKITAMCQSNLTPLLAEDPHVDELLSFQRPSGWLSHQQHGAIIDSLQLGHYDLGVLLTNSLSSAWWFWKGDVKNRIGYTGHWRSLLLDKTVPYPESRQPQHLVMTYKMLLEPLGITPSSSSPRLYLTKEEQKAAKECLASYGITPQQIVVGINPGAAYGSAKCWLPDRFKSVTAKLLENPAVVIVYFGDRAGAPLVQEICQGMPERVVNLAGKTNIRELMALIQTCDIFLTNDSGPMHIASALGTPLVALFGSTSNVATGPYQGGRVIHKHVECSPCYKRICPIDFRCMTRIGVDEVYKELKAMLSDIDK